MGLLKHIKNKKEKKLIKNKVNSLAGKEVDPNCITMLYFIDTNIKGDHGYSDKNRSFDYVIPVVKSGEKYFNIMTLEEVVFDENGNISNESIANLSQVYPEIPFTTVNYVGKEDATITFKKSDIVFNHADFLVTIKDSEGFESKYCLFRHIDTTFNTLQLITLREIFEHVQKLLSSKKNQTTKKAKDKEVKDNADLYKKINEVGEKNVPLDCVTFLFCIDPSRSNDEHSYSNGKIAFDYIIPVIKSGKRYFNIMTLEEVKLADANNGLNTDKITNTEMPKLVVCVGIEDVDMTIAKHEFSTDGYTFNISSKNVSNLESKIYNTGHNDGISDIIDIKTLRKLNKDLNEQLTKKYKQILKAKENKQKSKEARDFVNSL